MLLSLSIIFLFATIQHPDGTFSRLREQYPNWRLDHPIDRFMLSATFAIWRRKQSGIQHQNTRHQLTNGKKGEPDQTAPEPDGSASWRNLKLEDRTSQAIWTNASILVTSNEPSMGYEQWCQLLSEGQAAEERVKQLPWAKQPIIIIRRTRRTLLGLWKGRTTRRKDGISI